MTNLIARLWANATAPSGSARRRSTSAVASQQQQSRGAGSDSDKSATAGGQSPAAGASRASRASLHSLQALFTGAPSRAPAPSQQPAAKLFSPNKQQAATSNAGRSMMAKKENTVMTAPSSPTTGARKESGGDAVAAAAAAITGLDADSHPLRAPLVLDSDLDAGTPSPQPLQGALAAVATQQSAPVVASGGASGSGAHHQLNTSSTIRQANAAAPPQAPQRRQTTQASLSARRAEILRLTEQALNALNQGDYETYLCFCDTKMTSFEPENLGNLVDNADYRRFRLRRLADAGDAAHQPRQYSLLLNPAVHVLGEDAASIAYVRLTQLVDARTGRLSTEQSEETRVWRRVCSEQGAGANKWLCVHFHKSFVSAGHAVGGQLATAAASFLDSSLADAALSSLAAAAALNDADTAR